MKNTRREPDHELAMRIMWRRKQLKIKQTELAGAVGCDVRTVIRWEQAKTSPTHADMKAIAAALGLKDAAGLLDAERVLHGEAA